MIPATGSTATDREPLVIELIMIYNENSAFAHCFFFLKGKGLVMKKNKLMRYLAAALSCVIVVTSALPAYAEEIGPDPVPGYGYADDGADPVTDDEILYADDLTDDEGRTPDLEISYDGSESGITDTDTADIDEADLVIPDPDESEEDDIQAEADDLDDDIVPDYVNVKGASTDAASVSYNGNTQNYTDFTEAVNAWNTAGSGATLTLLKDITTTTVITVEHGDADHPMILDLNDHGILFNGCGADVRGITVSSGAFFVLNDSNGKTKRYITITDHRGTVVSSTSGQGRVEVKGGYITGASGGIIVRGTFFMNGGTICGNCVTDYDYSSSWEE